LPKTWKFLYSGEGDPFFNLALDEVLFFENQKGGSSPIFRIYGWGKAAISIGYFQNVSRACNQAECQKQNLPIIRRITGGRAVFHQKDLTYCLVGSSDLYPELGHNVMETYNRTSQAFLEGLKMPDWFCCRSPKHFGLAQDTGHLSPPDYRSNPFREKQPCRRLFSL